MSFLEHTQSWKVKTSNIGRTLAYARSHARVGLGIAFLPWGKKGWTGSSTMTAFQQHQCQGLACHGVSARNSPSLSCLYGPGGK